MDALQTLKMLLGLEDTAQDALLAFLLEESENTILSYCRIKRLPEALRSLTPVIAADLYRRRGYGSAETPKNVRSITQGERSVSYDVDTENILESCKARLKPYINRCGKLPSEVDHSEHI